MIQLLRVDHRLLHGQVAVSWVQNMLSKLEPYNPEGFLEHRPVKQEKTLTVSQALELLRLRGYTITNQ